MKNHQVGAELLYANRQMDGRSDGYKDIHHEADARFTQLQQPSNVPFHRVWSQVLHVGSSGNTPDAPPIGNFISLS
jgi:hypothetical protein